MEARGAHELKDLHVGSHTESLILIHMKKHVVPINIPRGMTDKELAGAIDYGTH